MGQEGIANGDAAKVEANNFRMVRTKRVDDFEASAAEVDVPGADGKDGGGRRRRVPVRLKKWLEGGREGPGFSGGSLESMRPLFSTRWERGGDEAGGYRERRRSPSSG